MATHAPPEGEDWIHEVKLDGYRLLGALQNGEARLLTRNGHDWTDRFPGVARVLARLPVSGAILDGEAVVLGADGVPDFHALQNAFRGYTNRRVVYYVFDLPFVSGFDYRDPGFYRDRDLSDLASTIASLGSGDTVHHKVLVSDEGGEIYYVEDDRGQLYRLEMLPRSGIEVRMIVRRRL